ncbi:MAG: nicotinate-nucleotide adenylyltransferase [Bacteroidota bacterium]
MKLGIFGGTFDPPHMGHLIVAEHVREELGLDRVVFVPCSTPPHKQENEITAGHHRMEMVRLAIAGNPAFDDSDMELVRGGVSYTVETLLEFSKQHPDWELFFLVGMDNIGDFYTWLKPERILELSVIVVVKRPGYEFPGELAIPDAVVCEVPDIEIGSRVIRERVREGRSIRHLVPDSVLDFIVDEKLYRGA